jgi:hypothetical protein
MKTKIKIASLIAVGITFTQCTKDTIDTVVCTGAIPTYKVDIKPIMDASCAFSGCHNTATKAEGYDLSTYAGTVAGAGKDAFLGSIQHKSGYKSMPQGGTKLSQDILDKVACWVQNGKPE